MPDMYPESKLATLAQRGTLDRGAREDLMGMIQATRSQDRGSREMPSELVAVKSSAGVPPGLYVGRTTSDKASESIYVLENPLGIHSSVSAAMKAYMDAQKKPREVSTDEEEKDIKVEQGAGFRSTILTGGSGLRFSPLPDLRRAGTLLSGLDKTDTFIIA